jgi:hypothetical protein
MIASGRVAESFACMDDSVALPLSETHDKPQPALTGAKLADVKQAIQAECSAGVNGRKTSQPTNPAPCKRAAKFGVSPTTACSCANPIQAQIARNNQSSSNTNSCLKGSQYMGDGVLAQSAAPRASPEDRAERRQVTVMFSDLVGSTGGGRSLGARIGA